MKRARLFLAGLLIALIAASPSIALASDVSQAIYSGTIIVANNSSAASDLVVGFSLSTTDLISQAYSNSNLTNIALQNSSGADVTAYSPAQNSTENWTFYIPSIGANAHVNYTLYTGGPSMGTTNISFPISPTSTVSSAGWVTPNNSWDGNTATQADYNFPGAGWSNNITVGVSSVLLGNTSFYLDRDSVGVTAANVSVKTNGNWVQVFSGIPNWAGWTTSNYTYTHNVTQVMITMNGSAAGQHGYVNEIKFVKAPNSNTNVSANLTNFAPISTADAPAYSVASPSSFYSSNITTSGNFTTGNVSGAGFPGSAVVDAGAAAAGVPNIWLWGLLGGFTLIMGGLAVSVMVRFGGGGNGELFIRMGLGIAIIGIMVALGKYDMWMIVFYLFIAGAFAMASRQYDIGASVGELNFIGFLAQSWVGLVGINRILEGSFMTSSEASQWNTLMFTQQYTIGDTFTLPIMNFSFWTEGLPNMVKWNYTFFGGNAQMIQYLLYSLTAILAFIIFGLIIGTLSRTFTR